MGETWDPDLVRQAAGVEGYEARYITQTPKYDRQILMLWGPQSDLARDPRWGRSEEVYGEDPFFNGTMAVAFIHGLQGDDPKYWQSAALLKHFLANSNEDHRNSSNSLFDQRLFWEYYSVPFRMGFQEGGARAVMASYNAWNGTPMVINPILKSIVRDKWGVDILSSDGGAVKLLVDPRHLYPNQEAAVVACLKAGINQFLDRYKDETLAALKDKSITEAEIDALVRLKFRITIKLGLLDRPTWFPIQKSTAPLTLPTPRPSPGTVTATAPSPSASLSSPSFCLRTSPHQKATSQFCRSTSPSCPSTRTSSSPSPSSARSLTPFTGTGTAALRLTKSRRSMASKPRSAPASQSTTPPTKPPAQQPKPPRPPTWQS